MGEFHIFSTNNYNITYTLENSNSNSWVGSWDSRYHIFVLGDNHILVNQPSDSRISQEVLL